ncbi:MAG: GNAT family N-acetyltransferase [Smithella sp.]
MKNEMVRLTTMNDFPEWLKLAREVEPLFGPMADEPEFLFGLRLVILEGNAFCFAEKKENFFGGIVISKGTNEIVWLAVVKHSRGCKIGTALLSEAIKHLDHTNPIMVRTFDKAAEAGIPARRLYKSFGFCDSFDAGLNSVGIPTVIMTMEINKV